jgi:dihydroorotate dehydrogenase electron transfer subunit
MTDQAAMRTVQLIDNCKVAPAHFRMTLRLPLSFTTPTPGQFVMIRNGECDSPFLPRPLSVYGFCREKDHAVMDLLYRVIGRGTAHFSRMKPGAGLSLLGPLGKGFSIPTETRKALVVAGGIGLAPLVFLLHEGLLPVDGKSNMEITFYLGARTAELLVGLERLNGFCNLKICTDDGSRGYHGPVSDLLQDEIDGYDPGETVIYACGPKPMLLAIGKLLQDLPFRCQVSLEERMACGVGACLGCAVAVRNAAGQKEYRRVCYDGPVFDLREISFAGLARLLCDPGESGSCARTGQGD